MSRYGRHPLRNEFSGTERDLLTDELLRDPTTRLYAAMTGGITLDTWAAVSTAASVAALAGSKLELPRHESGPPKVPRAELESARALLARNSGIVNLPEE